MKFMKKNYIIGIAITLAILMCMPVLTINAIDSMSGGKCQNGAIHYSMTTAETTSPSFSSIASACDYYLGKSQYSDATSNNHLHEYTGTGTSSGNRVVYNPLTQTGWYYANNILVSTFYVG